MKQKSELQDEVRNPVLDPEWFTKNKIKGVLRRLDRENEELLAEVEKLLKDYLIAMLDLTHRRLVDGKIGLTEYYSDTQMLANCAERINQNS